MMANRRGPNSMKTSLSLKHDAIGLPQFYLIHFNILPVFMIC